MAKGSSDNREAKGLIEKCTPQELCDKYHAIHAEIYQRFDIGFDIFGRTTTPLQTDITQDIFRKLYNNGFLKERMTTQLYCEEHHYADARGDQCDMCGQLLEPLQLKNPRCKIDGFAPITKDTKHIFLELDKLQPEVEDYFQKASTNGAWPNNGKSITLAWLKEGLQPRSITRDMKWGTQVPFPGYEDKVIYSWFDACIGYVSITAKYTDQWEKWWRNPEDVQLYQFIGKDNVVFHSVIFPASQIGTRGPWTKVHHLSTTDYLTYEGGKFSKSRGIGVFGDSAQQTGGSADVWRYYLLSRRPETGDTEFSWDSFISANNSILLNNLGNFASRVLKFVNSRFYNNIVPNWTRYHEPSFETWKEEINRLLTKYVEVLNTVKLRAGLATALHISQQGNLFLQTNKLNDKLHESEPAKCTAVISLTKPLKSICTQLRVEPLAIPDHWSADSIKPSHEIGKSEHLFRRIQPEKAQTWRKMFGSKEVYKEKEEHAATKAKKSTASKAEKTPKPQSAAMN
ncbi:methionyl-tRNA synthetase [Histoplasma capsulatum var. duboisii H88]|uniref:methionine--tRNA ligase n=1 Tax=Ajellomyces capsulatus (strain H88) TaxID=544711 RepID=F0U6K3_AJEC8|nr:methionyl-tRNA synthetase [Histoplasma capsulatum var. duboisii H88]